MVAFPPCARTWPSFSSSASLGDTVARHYRGGLVALADGTALALGGYDDVELPQRAATRIETNLIVTDGPFLADDLQRSRGDIDRGAVLLHDGSVFAPAGVAAEDALGETSERYFPHYETDIDADRDGIVDVLQ